MGSEFEGTTRQAVLLAGGVALSAGLWTALFGALTLVQPHRSHTWNGRLVALIHGAVISLLALVIGLLFGPSPFSEPGGESNIFEILVQVVCLGYFAFDTIFCLFFDVYGGETPLMAVHHAVSVAGMVTSLHLGVSGAEMCATICLAECTNPLFQLRWFMREAGLPKGDWRYEVNDLVFLAAFLTLRGPVAQYLAYCVVTHARTAPAFVGLASAFAALNWVLLVGMLEFAHRRYAVPLLRWALRGGGPIGGRHSSEGQGGPEARLSNGACTFDEVTSHKTVRLLVERCLSQWNLISNKGSKEH